MRKAANPYLGQAKTDSRSAFIIADTAQTMPHTPRSVGRNSEDLSDLTTLSGFDDDILVIAPGPSTGYAVFSPESAQTWSAFSLAARLPAPCYWTYSSIKKVRQD